MAFSADKMRQMTEMKLAAQLLEDERMASDEIFESTRRTNEETIRRLRQENKRLRRQLAEETAGNEKVIREAFHDRGMEKEAFRYMSEQEALKKLEHSMMVKKKQLNAEKHTTKNLLNSLEALKVEYERMKRESSDKAQSANGRARKEEDDAMKLRSLENRLYKTQLKLKAAEDITMNYQQLKSHMQEESLTFGDLIDRKEAEILKQMQALRKMQATNDAAQLAKEAAKAELQHQEELYNKELKERECILAYRKKVEECKIRSEKTVRRVQRTAIQQDELSIENQCSTPRVAGEEEKAVSALEEAFGRIKEATGITDVQEIAQRFISQKETHQHLLKLKEENETVLQQLREQKELLNQQLQDMKHSGEAKLSSERQMLEEREQQLQAQQQKCDAAKERLDGLEKTFSTVRAGVEHLADKLQHITPSDYTAADVSPDSDEFVLELMKQCELKLQRLHEEVQGKDVAAVMKEMDEEEFFVKIEMKLPAYNTRVTLTEDDTPEQFVKEEESEEADGDIISREELKRQSQLIVNSKSKKKQWKKKAKF